jgi:hypothetical protein
MTTANQRFTIRDTLRILYCPGDVFEIRVVGFKGKPKNYTVSGYFDDVETALIAIDNLDANKGIVATYVTLNRINPRLLDRSVNKLTEYPENTTADADVLRYQWLLVDADAKRPAGISSTDAEHDAALVKIHLIAETLVSEGWPEPILADSGNGGHALFPLDLPTDRDTTAHVEKLLKSLARRFDDPKGSEVRIIVDTSVGNPARITKLYGTMTRKGDKAGKCPQRQSSLLWSDHGFVDGFPHAAPVVGAGSVCS